MEKVNPLQVFQNIETYFLHDKEQMVLWKYISGKLVSGDGMGVISFHWDSLHKYLSTGNYDSWKHLHGVSWENALKIILLLLFNISLFLKLQ